MGKIFNREIRRIRINDPDTITATAENINNMKTKSSVIVNPDPNPVPVTESKPEPVPVPVVDVESIVKSAVAEAARFFLEKAQTDVDAIKQSSEQQIQGLKTEIESIKQSAQQANQEEIKALQEQVKAATEAAQSSKQTAEQAQEALKIAQEAERKLAEATQIKGSQMGFPNVNTVTTTDSDRPVESMQEAVAIIESSLIEKASPSGELFTSFDYVTLDDYVRQNQKQITKDLEVSFKKNGFLRGPNVTKVKEAATTFADLPGANLEVLSSLARQTHRPGLIFWQFCPTEINFQKAQGTKIDLYRAAYGVGTSTDPADWELSSGGSFVEVRTDGDPVSTGVVQAELKEWGMGKPSTNIKPVIVPTFVMAYSMINLLQIVQRNIVYNYYEWEDLKIRSLWKPTSRVLYNNNDAVETTPGNIGTGGKGTFGRKFATALYEYAHRLQILPFDNDNSYGLVLTTKALQQLKDDLDNKWQSQVAVDLPALTNMLQPVQYPQSEADTRIQGYQGKWYNFHIFTTNSYGVGAAGTEGVQNVAFDDGTFLTRSSYLFGGETVGRGIGDPMRIVQHENTNYQRRNTFIWLSTQGLVAKDVDPVGYDDESDVPQQLRVLEIRTTDVEL